MKFIPRKLYAKIEKKLFDRFWENELLNFLKLKLFFFKFKIENFTKIKKKSSYIHPRNIHTDFEKNPNIGCWVTDVDRPTDLPTDRRRATAIGPVDLKMCIFGYSGGPGWPINNQTGPILLPSYPLTYINLHIKYGSNPIRFFKVIA